MIELTDYTKIKENKVYVISSIPWGIGCIFTPFRDGYKKISFEDGSVKMYYITNKEFLSAIQYGMGHHLNGTLWELDNEDEELNKLKMSLELKK